MPDPSNTYNINELRGLLIDELLATPMDRQFSSPSFPAAQAVGSMFYADCLGTIVTDVLEALGFHRLDSIEESRGRVAFGKVDRSGRLHVIRLTWTPDEDTFSPIDDITGGPVPVCPVAYVRRFYHPKPSPLSNP